MGISPKTDLNSWSIYISYPIDTLRLNPVQEMITILVTGSGENNSGPGKHYFGLIESLRGTHLSGFEPGFVTLFNSIANKKTSVSYVDVYC